ncbi:LysR family transcriptional regulator [Pokkaliibacter sp. CJK22405]|uniref:LysR family transcriptional regulator n=1 Tax=Pokkaliibacter sp. CJK22405 TaxID=3384615 RepID=UPI0039856843
MLRENWNDLIVFAHVCEQGSFTAASRLLGLSPSAISHLIKKLEARLNTRLLHRSTRSIAPTEVGQALLTALTPAVQSLNQALEDIDTRQTQTSGRVRITSHRVAVLYTLMPRLKAFQAAYPNITLEIQIEDGLVDFVKTGFDAGIRRSESLAPDMIAVPIDKPVSLAIVASPTYLELAGWPKTPHELTRHRCMNYRFGTSGALFNWPFKEGERTFQVEVPSQLVFNDSDMLLQAVISGCGIACLTENQAKDALAQQQLVRLFEEQSIELPANFIYYLGHRHVPPALRVFIDFFRLPG